MEIISDLMICLGTFLGFVSATLMAPYGLGEEKAKEVTLYLESNSHRITTLLIVAVVFPMLILGVIYAVGIVLVTSFPNHKDLSLVIWDIFAYVFVICVFSWILFAIMIYLEKSTRNLITKMCNPYYFFRGLLLGAFGIILVVGGYLLGKYA